MIVLDTNVYLDTRRDAALGERIATFVATRREVVGLSSVVLAELLVGARTETERTRVLDATVALTPPERVLTPTHDDWRAAGDALAALGGDEATKGRSFWNDLLIAASCSRANATLVTSNLDDFRRIQRVILFALAARPA